MGNSYDVPDQNNVICTGMDWSVSIRGSALPQRRDTVADPRRRYEQAGRTEQELDGSVTFHASDAQMAAWQAEADQRGRSFDQIIRYHLATGVDVQGPDGLILTMTCRP
jgi:hypothetical protein